MFCDGFKFGKSRLLFWSQQSCLVVASCEVVGFLGLVIITRGHQNLTVVVGVNQGRFSYNKLSQMAITRIIGIVCILDDHITSLANHLSISLLSPFHFVFLEFAIRTANYVVALSTWHSSQ